MSDIEQYMTVDKVRALYGDADSVHDFDHILRVVNLAERIARQEGADVLIVRAAALLHDLGRAESQAQDLNHAAVAAERAGQLLFRVGGFPGLDSRGAARHCGASLPFTSRSTIPRSTGCFRC